MNKNNINDRCAYIVLCLEIVPRSLAMLISRYDYEFKGESQILTKGYNIEWLSFFCSDNDKNKLSNKNDNLIIFGEKDNIHIFDLECNKIVETLNCTYNYPNCGTGFFDKTVVYSTFQGKIIVWNMNTNENKCLAFDFQEIKHIINVIRFQDKIIAGFSNGQIKIWNLSVEAEGQLKVTPGSEGPTTRGSSSEGAKPLSGGESICEDTIYFDNGLVSFDIFIDARIICASDTKIKVWNIEKKCFDLEIDYSSLIVRQVIAVGKLIAVTTRYQKAIILHDSVTGNQVAMLDYSLDNFWPGVMAALPNGKLACASGCSIKIFDPCSGIINCQQSFSTNDNDEYISLIKVINDGRIISHSNNRVNGNCVRIWS